MKRHSALQALSREHHPALVLAMACKRAAHSGSEEKIFATCSRVAREYDADMARHFLAEETKLLPLLQHAGQTSLVKRTLDEHKNLRALVESLRCNEAAALEAFGQALSDHVRFEEQELFPTAEQVVPHSLLASALENHAISGEPAIRG